MYARALRTSLAIFGLVSALCAAAQAQDHARPGPYVGAGALGGAYPVLEDELEDALASLGYFADVDVDPSAGFEIYAGYRVHPNFAIEAEFEMLPETELEVDGIEFAELETWTLTGNAKIYPLTGRVQPFVLLGMGVMQAELEDSVGLGISEEEADLALRFGGGVDYYFTEHVALSGGVDYVLPTGDVEDLDYVSFGAGVMLRF